jgi:predicted enzyme related to lactoylglutathione lyase
VARVIGLGGIFFKAADPAKLGKWYRENLAMPVEEYGAVLPWASLPEGGYAVWSPFATDTGYFQPSEREFMFNLVVDDLDGCLARVREAGATLAGKPEGSEYGRFGWFLDPEGNKVELWEPRKNGA